MVVGVGRGLFLHRWFGVVLVVGGSAGLVLGCIGFGEGRIVDVEVGRIGVVGCSCVGFDCGLEMVVSIGLGLKGYIGSIPSGAAFFLSPRKPSNSLLILEKNDIA